MKKFVVATVVVSVLVFFGAALAAESQPSAKATAQVGNIAKLDLTDLPETTILQQTLKTASQKDLFIDVSLECGLYTRTKSGKAGTVDTSFAKGGVYVTVLVDGIAAYPGEVKFCEREQTLTTYLQGILNLTTGLVVTDEYVELILKTMDANSFNFVMPDLSAGVHTVAVKARIDTDVSGTAEAKGSIGKGSVTVESVRMIRNEDIELQ